MITKLFEKSLETLKQRGADNAYDKGSFENGERSGAQIARIYNAITGQSISEADAWTFLQCLKLVRMENQMRTGQGDLLDTAVDLLSYTALKAEAVLNEHRPAQVAQLVAGDSHDDRIHADSYRVAGSANTDDGVAIATIKGCAMRFSGLPPYMDINGRNKITTLNHPCVLDLENDPTADR